MQIIGQETPAFVPPATAVLGFDQDAFDRACAVLMTQVMRDGPPDALIAIPTGGLHVARAMVKAVAHRVAILSLTCRRSSTRYKTGGGTVLKTVLSRLPRPVVDQLRVAEHALLTRKPAAHDPDGYLLHADEIVRLGTWLRNAGPAPSLVVVDDAVDTGTTLSRILDIVRSQVPLAARIRSAVITVTTPQPAALPDYTLYRRQLCRFPWSFDA
jgi:hypoxanthine phosphoribosyltransferase